MSRSHRSSATSSAARSGRSRAGPGSRSGCTGPAAGTVATLTRRPHASRIDRGDMRMVCLSPGTNGDDAGHYIPKRRRANRPRGWTRSPGHDSHDRDRVWHHPATGRARTATLTPHEERRDMLTKRIAALAAAGTVALLTPAVGSAQEMPMRTPDGQPDVSGTFTFRTLTPLQRPRAVRGRRAPGRRVGRGVRGGRAHPPEPRPVRSRAGRAVLSTALGGRRALLQRVLVRARSGADLRQADVPHRRSA